MDFGTVASSAGAEGAAPTSDWAGWEQAGRVPQSADGNGFATRYRDDFALLAAHGIPSHRITLEWARLEPRMGERDAVGVAHYRDVLRAGADAGIAVWACLHHLSLPGWFSEDERGFLDERAARHTWPAHVDWIAETFGDQVAGWVPIHEPATYAALAYRDGVVPPGRTDEDDYMTGLRAILHANREAGRLLRSGDAPVFTAHAASMLPPSDELRADADVFTALGLTHPAVDDGSLLAALHNVVELLENDGVPLAITACGIGTDDEDERAAKLEASLDQVANAVADGIDLRGFWWRTAIDGYEWHDGFGPKWGLFDRDRNPRPALPNLGSLTGL